MAGFGEKKRTGPVSAADRVAAQAARHSMVERGVCEDPKRRARLEKDDAAWLSWYCPETYFLPFERPHMAIIDSARETMESGRDMVVAAERGIGKSFILYGLTFKLVATEEQPFPVYIPWGDKDKTQGFNFWIDCLAYNDRIHADYPEITAPFKHGQGASQRVRAVTWADTGVNTHARINASKGMIVLPDARGVIGSSTMNGNPRGLNYKHPGAGAVRPSMALVDDIQDDKTAASGELVKKTIRTVNGAIRGLKRAGGDFSILMSGNCICSGDVMEHFLNQTGWMAVRVSCVEKWPEGYDDPSTDVGALWEEWGQKWLTQDGEAAFFRKHRKAMTAGMVLNSPKAYMHKLKDDAKDKRRKQSRPITAAHAVMREYYTMGNEAFMAERQQQPVDPIESTAPYVLTPEIVLSRTDKSRPAQVVPDWAQIIIAATDVNRSYALTTVVVAFGAHQTAAVLWYGIHKMHVAKESTEIERRRIIYEELAKHGREIGTLPCRPQSWIIDGGGSPEGCVIQFAFNAPQICGIPAACCFGRGWKNYRPTAKATYKVRVGEQYHHVSERRDRQWIILNADYWREIMQRGWTGEPGGPGSCSLPRGNHSDFAAQITREQLAGKDNIGGRTVWVWNTAPGPHDYGDCMHMAYVGAAVNGIGTGGQVVRRKYVEQRKCKVARET